MASAGGPTLGHPPGASSERGGNVAPPHPGAHGYPLLPLSVFSAGLARLLADERSRGAVPVRELGERWRAFHGSVHCPQDFGSREVASLLACAASRSVCRLVPPRGAPFMGRPQTADMVIIRGNPTVAPEEVERLANVARGKLLREGRLVSLSAVLSVICEQLGKRVALIRGG